MKSAGGMDRGACDEADQACAVRASPRPNGMYSEPVSGAVRSRTEGGSLRPTEQGGVGAGEATRRMRVAPKQGYQERNQVPGGQFSQEEQNTVTGAIDPPAARHATTEAKRRLLSLGDEPRKDY